MPRRIGWLSRTPVPVLGRTSWQSPLHPLHRRGTLVSSPPVLPHRPPGNETALVKEKTDVVYICFIWDVPFIAWSPGYIRSSKQGDIQWLTVYIRRESKSLNAQMEKVPYHVLTKHQKKSLTDISEMYGAFSKARFMDRNEPSVWVKNMWWDIYAQRERENQTESENRLCQMHMRHEKQS